MSVYSDVNNSWGQETQRPADTVKGVGHEECPRLVRSRNFFGADHLCVLQRLL
jgi:hypothetical protein